MPTVLVVDLVLQEQIVDAAILPHRVEVHPAERRAPRRVELPHPAVVGWRNADGGGTVFEAAVRGVSLDGRAHLAPGCIEILGGDRERETEWGCEEGDQ
jgi:hypothetical protein